MPAFDELDDLRRLVSSAIGDVPCVAALNKCDLAAEWRLTPADERSLASRGFYVIRTSAKSGTGVEEAFNQLAQATLKATPPHAT